MRFLGGGLDGGGRPTSIGEGQRVLVLAAAHDDDGTVGVLPVNAALLQALLSERGKLHIGEALDDVRYASVPVRGARLLRERGKLPVPHRTQQHALAARGASVVSGVVGPRVERVALVGQGVLHDLHRLRVGVPLDVLEREHARLDLADGLRGCASGLQVERLLAAERLRHAEVLAHGARVQVVGPLRRPEVHAANVLNADVVTVSLLVALSDLGVGFDREDRVDETTEALLD